MLTAVDRLTGPQRHKMITSTGLTVSRRKLTTARHTCPANRTNSAVHRPGNRRCGQHLCGTSHVRVVLDVGDDCVDQLALKVHRQKRRRTPSVRCHREPVSGDVVRVARHYRSRVGRSPTRCGLVQANRHRRKSHAGSAAPRAAPPVAQTERGSASCVFVGSIERGGVDGFEDFYEAGTAGCSGICRLGRDSVCAGRRGRCPSEPTPGDAVRWASAGWCVTGRGGDQVQPAARPALPGCWP